MSAWTVIERKEVTTNPSEITFSSISGSFTDLCLLVGGRADPNAANGGVVLLVGFNGSYANITGRFLAGIGNDAVTGTDTAMYIMTSANDYTANTHGNSTLYIPNYTSDKAKSIYMYGVSENNATASRQVIMGGLWNPSTQAAITSISIKTLSGSILANSSFTLYGITKGSSGGVTVS